MFNILKHKKPRDYKYAFLKTLLTVHESESLQHENWYRISKLWLEKLLNKKNMTPEEVDQQIKYFLPSSLYYRDARPKLSQPRCIINNWKELYDKDGKVISSGYFTSSPLYNDLIYETIRRLYVAGELPQVIQYQYLKTSDTVNKLMASHVSQMSHQSPQPDNVSNNAIDVRWVTQIEFNNVVRDKVINTYQYIFFIKLIEKLFKNERSYMFMDFISQFMVVLDSSKNSSEELKRDENGYIKSVGYRKTAVADILLREGTGKITVNGIPFDDYFKYDLDKLQVLMPFDAIGKRGDFDVISNVIKSGPSSQAGAMRLAISRALAVISPEYQTILDEAKLLIQDVRLTERKKFGTFKARKPYKLVKR